MPCAKLNLRLPHHLCLIKIRVSQSGVKHCCGLGQGVHLVGTAFDSAYFHRWQLWQGVFFGNMRVSCMLLFAA